MARDTIFALSTGRPPAAIAIVRISGPAARTALETLAGRVPAPRVATFATLHSMSGAAIDDAVVLYFPESNSATGEDLAELQVHGSRAVLATIFEEIGRISGMRAAEAGEFTRRAFENGKLDLTEAEGLDDLIHADTEAQRRQALRQFKGLLGERAETWRRQIIEALALVEAGIDFSDEGDVPDELIAPARDKVARLQNEIEVVLAASTTAERLRDGLVVAIAGPPNAGKSTLLNRLARREAAIVSPYAGTTRDVIEVHLDLGGFPVVLLDTAGIRETSDPVEEEGVRRARERAADADLVLWLTDSMADPVVRGSDPVAESRLWLVLNKIDLMDRTQQVRASNVAGRVFQVSATQGQGIAELTDELGRFAADYFGAGEAALVTRARQKALLEAAASALRRAGGVASGADEILAEELRVAAQALGRLLGKVDVEDILEKIFKDFCIGK
ncbi:tRNA uridine-5-carboxymethylaminomethyl(34) synthesis GTPase MnmE [Bradyrhizobium sp. LHD-71]|uniref:tRNA uridine-5-carboxymethylaminomethyl(34) synthesis GTPase MnmE n=1 Tax=Bradyrhizobium sp. LHD-71 TaxID=3072141 RepID=UPI00280F71BD|nr:tRNA uridine-5-carboxymethylaminomethyl(34) synthesis GTPase MnmE [Bradyrhizobium sp. LHD-71]MDQ8732637.1 tRNA uridine-5-carboxymethylaminomethyl(34) synthesis GTPase MnmE [Bradyrhizobium sp. LHD-71]